MVDRTYIIGSKTNALDYHHRLAHCKIRHSLHQKMHVVFPHSHLHEPHSVFCGEYQMLQQQSLVVSFVYMFFVHVFIISLFDAKRRGITPPLIKMKNLSRNGILQTILSTARTASICIDSKPLKACVNNSITFF